MKHWIRLQLTLLACFVLAVTASAQAPQPGYVPPDAAEVGLAAHNQHLAVLQTNCTSVDQAIDLRDALVRNGALVSIITSPQRMLAWVPPESKDAIMGTQLQMANGEPVGVLSVSYSSAEFQRDLDQQQYRIMADVSEADEAIVEYLDFIKRPLTEEDMLRIREREKEIEEQLKIRPEMDCVGLVETDEHSPRAVIQGIPTHDPSENALLRRTKVRGYIVHSSFFVESKSGTGTWNWDPTVYSRYRNFYIAAMNYWSSFVARYGKSITHHWRLYSPYHTASQVSGEPVAIGEDSFIPQIVSKLATINIFNLPPSWSWAGPGYEWCWFYNNQVRDAFNSDEAICGFIAYKPSGDEGIWPHAAVIRWGNGDREGVYFAMDTQYWQAELDPFSAPRRNVIAHEIGHIWGAPDEYKNDNCGWSYRGMPNVNCQATQPAYGRSGSMRGWDGIMKTNYISGNSLATPVHTGVINAGQAVPVRMFASQPTNVTLEFRNCDNIQTVNRATPIGIPVDFDYCHRVVAPSNFTRSGTKWYFSYWEIKRKSGATSEIDYYANELPSYSLPSSFSNPVTDVKAVYTSNPPDIFAANTTLTAHLATASGSATPPPAVALRWRNKFDMDAAETYVEYEASPGNWKQLDGNHHLGKPTRVNIGQWTGVLILKVPNATGSGSTDIQSNRTYRFRIVGEFNTNRGTPSQSASITTRPSTPVDTVYCVDANEPATLANPKLLPSSGPGMDPYVIEGAIPLQPLVGEFSFNVPQWDYFRVTVINVTPNVFGERLVLKLRVKDGSDFEPKFRAQRAGTSTHTSSTVLGGVHTLRLTSDGEYIIKVESQVSGGAWNDLVNRYGGFFSFGEYEIEVMREQIEPGFKLPDLCLNCVKFHLVQPFPGQVIMRPHPKFDLFTKGVDKSTPLLFNMYYQVPPGYSFQGFGGDFGNLRDNPAAVNIGPNTEAREYEVFPIIEPISSALAELVVINPEGPGGPFDDRQSGPVGSTLTATATAPSGFEFVGWGGDTTTTTNPLTVTMWQSKKLIAYYRQKPCVPEPMSKWQHAILFRNARQNEITLEYGMQEGAGDGLEAGQTDLPPTPPPTAFDIRWLNIPGSQGSLTDIRAIKASHTFQGQVQTGPTNPVTMTWGALPASPSASFTLKIQGEPGSIDMRSASSYTFANDGRYIFTIEVKEPICPEPTKENEVVITTEDVDTKNWPCVDLKLKVRDRQTGDPRPYYNPFNIKLMERMPTGAMKPTQITDIVQRDSILVFRLCGDPDDPQRDREIVVINDNEDDDQVDDTTRVPIDPPIPDGTGDPERFVFRTSGDWEMVSTPLELQNPDFAALAQEPDMKMYLFDTDAGQYDAASDMVLGRGYWIKAGPLEEVLIGLSKSTFEWTELNGIGEPYGYGWNMVGALLKPVPVASIQQNPAGGLKSIFGWDPGQGYIVPTQMEPGKGYWVRVDAGTNLRISTSGFTGSGAGATAYSKAVAGMDLAGLLTLENAEGHTRRLYVAGDRATDELRNVLALPAAPPADILDVRTAEGTQFVFPGETTVHVGGQGRCVLSTPVSSDRILIEVRDEDGRLLHTFDGSAGDHLILDVTGTSVLKLNTRVRPADAKVVLGSNYPNPFQTTSSTVIPYTLSEEGAVHLTIYDMLGRQVRALVRGSQSQGSKYVTWDGMDDTGAAVPAGMYTYRLETATGVVSRTLTIVK
ncbi:MAG: T9SS type A sorting domain-containing protein [Bacteroidetes bacterium]|nr:T9SS type A sorting domain-containing protein [Bacteroidota bacterium]